MRWSVRSAVPGDSESILAVVRDAFSTGGRDGHEEVEIVLDTWDLGAALPGLELVVDNEGRPVGHVLGARARLNGREVAAVAPLAVRTDRQGEGIGTALMTEVIHRAEAAGYALIALLGLPEFYSRFGFEPAGPLGIVYPAVGPDHPHFLVRRLARYDATYRGDFVYCWESEED
jgi:putative acetyltransferase